MHLKKHPLNQRSRLHGTSAIIIGGQLLVFISIFGAHFLKTVATIALVIIIVLAAVNIDIGLSD